MKNNKFIEIPSFNYDTIDEMIKRLKEYSKHYGGKSTYKVDMSFEQGFGAPDVYQGLCLSNSKETIPEKNRRLIKESWDGELDSSSFCDTCKHNEEDEHYLRYCYKKDFSTCGVTISMCIDYEEKE